MKPNITSTEQKILGTLKEKSNSYLSGQVLSKSLDISRTAVWKHINNLRKMGYPIEADSGKGYKLAGELPFNALEIANRLKTSIIGRTIHFYQKIDSTNTAAYNLALNGAEEGTCVVADFQEKGKGRLGRIWESPKGANIYTSIILRPDILPATAPKLTLMAAVAVAETISKFSAKKPAVKWPNDILLNSKKVSGILTEMNSGTDKINFVILGIGVNLNMTRDMLPKDLRPIATSLKEETGKDISRIDFLNTLYLNIEKWHKDFLKNGFAPVREAWKGYFNMAGKTVSIKDTDRQIEGIALTIDDDGYLLVREKSGNTAKIISGDVVIKQG